MPRSIHPFIFLGCLGVACPQDPVGQATSEVRIDAGPDRLDSEHTRMCVNDEGTTYVLWIDAREGTTDLWLDRKLPSEDREDGWFVQPVRVNAASGSTIAHPQLACTDDAVYVVWEDDRDGLVQSSQVYFQRSVDEGQTWMPQDRLIENDPDGRSDSLAPVIHAVGPNVYVAWSDDFNGAFDIFFARSTDSGITWQPPLRVDNDDPGSAYSGSPQLATGHDGDHVYVVWEDFRNGATSEDGGSDVYFARSTDKGQSFGADQRLDTGEDPGRSDSFVPRIAADDDQVYVVWHDARNGAANDIYYNHSADGGVSWASSARRIGIDPAGLNQAVYPQLCVQGDTAHFSWHDNRDQGFYRVYYNRAVAGELVGPEFRLDEHKLPGERHSTDTRITCDGDEVLVAWLDASEDLSDAGYRDLGYDFSSDRGRTWLQEDRDPEDRELFRLDSLQAGQSYKRDLQVQLHAGSVFAAWTDGRSGSSDVYFQQLVPGESPVVRTDAPNPAAGGR